MIVARCLLHAQNVHHPSTHPSIHPSKEFRVYLGFSFWRWNQWNVWIIHPSNEFRVYLSFSFWRWNEWKRGFIHPKTVVRVSIERGIIHLSILPSIHPSKGVVGGSAGIKREANLCVNSSLLLLLLFVGSRRCRRDLSSVARSATRASYQHKSSKAEEASQQQQQQQQTNKQTRSFRSAILRARKTRIGCCVCAICFVFENL